MYEAYHRPPDFCFASAFGNINNIFYNLFLISTQGGVHYGQLLSYTQTFFSSFDINIFFCPRYLMFLIVVSEWTLWLLSEKYNFDMGYSRQSMKINAKKQVWETMIFWNSYSEGGIFGTISTQFNTITTRICPQSSVK